MGIFNNAYPDIRQINDNYPYDLLLLADETVEAINKYLYDSEVYIAKLPSEDIPIGIFCLYRINNDTIEIKNIAVAEEYQDKGVGSYLMNRIQEIAKEKKYKEVIVGTGDCGIKQIRFYEKNGFVLYGIKENFFLNNYDKPIYENGVMLKDMVMLRKRV